MTIRQLERELARLEAQSARLSAARAACRNRGPSPLVPLRVDAGQLVEKMIEYRARREDAFFGGAGVFGHARPLPQRGGFGNEG